MPATISIARPLADEHAEYYRRYISRIRGEDALPVLAAQMADVERLLGGLPETRALHRYAPGKWSVKEIVGHLCDAERVFSYRALRFGRADATPLPGFDENLFVPAGRFDARPMDELLAELRAVRAATLALYRSFDADALTRGGVASDNFMSVRALAWVTAGHTDHHLAILRERYGLGG